MPKLARENKRKAHASLGRLSMAAPTFNCACYKEKTRSWGCTEEEVEAKVKATRRKGSHAEGRGLEGELDRAGAGRFKGRD